MEQKFIKRGPNSTFLATKTILWLEQDSANLLLKYSQQLHICPEYIVEYLLDTLYATFLTLESKDDLHKINNALIAYDSNNNCSYKLVKVDDDEKLPRKERISKK